MRLDRLTIRDFRNLPNVEVTLAPGLNVLWGANAQGKTNVLEAIYFLVTGRSFRARRERECIRWDEDDLTAFVRGRVLRREGEHTLQVGLQGAVRRIEIDGAPIAKLATLWGKLNAVLFTPDDLQIVKGPPALRRQFLDTEISQVRPSYLTWLQRYHAALRERTALMRAVGMGQRRTGIEPWDKALAEAAAEIFAHRRDFVRHLEEAAQRTYHAVSGETEMLTLAYHSFLDTQEPLTRDECIALHLQLLADARETDIDRGQTSVGPHRDDLWIFIDETEARAFGSQGQQRAVMLAIRLAEVELMEAETGEPPLPLLDDIISELDPERRRRFFSLLRQEVQSIITTVEEPEALRDLPIARTFAVSGGRVTPLPDRPEA